MALEQYSTFEVRNNYVSLRFSCRNDGKRIREAIEHLRVSDNAESYRRVESGFSSSDPEVSFLFDGIERTGSDITMLAAFFENTDYPLRVKALRNGVTIDSLYIAGHGSGLTTDSDNDDSLLYGVLNFHNQVGHTDMCVNYSIDGIKSKLCFNTEVLSYKMDYRTDLKSIIADIEQEYSMLSYSFLKQTYLNFKEKHGDSTDLIWWQIFKQCYENIVASTKIIINSPKRRLRSVVKNERAERLRIIDVSLEREFGEFQDDPHHLYRTEDLILSKDTVENRFLKYAIKEVHRRFTIIREHIKNAMKISDKVIAADLDIMDEEMSRLSRHPFFRQIGQFKGFTQDSLVMKRGRGYSDIYRNWLLLQCGYDLEEGTRKLEIKDVSELYEIWCFIKVKNMVQDILGNSAKATTSGKELTNDFVRQLVYGQKSDVVFERNGVELAVVSYNAQVEEEESDIESSITGTSTFTTVQRPDIVLRLSKNSENDIVYTYLFDAKYRLSDKKIAGHTEDVPPVDAINQMHRYRDAIYYDSRDNGIKREIIGGYVLYPGDMDADSVRHSYYHESHEKIGIGAFPLKPGKTIIKDGNKVVDDSSSETVLKDQIRIWLNDESRLKTLLSRSIPQRGLKYVSAFDDSMLVGFIRSPRHRDWIFEKGLYNIRFEPGNTMNPRTGSVSMTKELALLEKVLLYKINAEGDFEIEGLFGLKDKNMLPSVYSYQEIKKLDELGQCDYPFDESSDSQDTSKQYIVFEIDKNGLEIGDMEKEEILRIIKKRWLEKSEKERPSPFML